MASFSFRLLLAELPAYLGQPKAAMDKLTEMSLISSEVNLRFLTQDNLYAIAFKLDKRFLWKGAVRIIRILATKRKPCKSFFSKLRFDGNLDAIFSHI